MGSGMFRFWLGLCAAVLFMNSVMEPACAQDWLKTGNLAFQAKATASSTQKGNAPARANDGNLKTRWCAQGPQTNEWLQLDLAQPQHLRTIRIHWESPRKAYQYRIEGSADGKQWQKLIDQSQNKTAPQRPVIDRVDAPGTRYLRITFLGTAGGGWGSIREVEASSGNLPEIPDHPVGELADIKAPPEFKVSLFAIPPAVNYPVCLTAAATGEVFVGVDDQGSLGKIIGRGKVLRCVDTNGDGTADQINQFAQVDHPRGLLINQESLWVLHPPTLSVYHDTNRDGVSDKETVLIDGISTADVAARGGDHTTNGIQFGIDGWIYIAVGDYGVTHAQGTDGTVLSRRGGGIIRVRPDGKEMEIYCWGLRNILDACIDPEMNIFTRDNTNDGGEWNVRLSQIFQSAEYGYPSLFMNFREETMPPLADFGGGSGCGGLFLDDARWPAGFNHTLYTCDWGRSKVYLHRLKPNGVTFQPHQEEFVSIPRPTDLDVDGSGRMYLSSWKNGMFNYDGPNIGFVAQLVPHDFQPKPFPNLKTLTVPELIQLLAASDMKHRQSAQFEILRRGRNPAISTQLRTMLTDSTLSRAGRIAVLYTLKQLDGVESHPAILALLRDPEMQPFALRALTDRLHETAQLPSAPFVEALKSSSPTVQAQALISLGRLGRTELAEAILPLTAYSGSLPAHNETDPARVLPHLAIRALVRLNAIETCLKGLAGPHRHGAILALRNMHDEAAVSGLIHQLPRQQSVSAQIEILATLIRLYYQEGAYEKNWWGTRPDRTGPYYDRQSWKQSSRIAAAVKSAFDTGDDALKLAIVDQLKKHLVKVDGIETGPDGNGNASESAQPIAMPVIDPANKNQIANLPYEDVLERVLKLSGEATRGRVLFQQQSCIACHTFAPGQTPKGPHLVDIGKRYKRAELIESILKPSAKIAQGFDTYAFITDEGKIYTGFVVGESAEEIQLRQTDGLSVILPKQKIDERAKQPQSMMPQQIAGNLTPEQLADLLAWLESLK